MLNTLAVSGYRSLRDLAMPLGRLNLVTGPNGSGKSNLYRALRLLAEAAQGRVIPTLAREGGLDSTLWAGPEKFSRGVLRGEHPVQGVVRKNPVSLRLGFASDHFSYAIDLGLPPPPSGAFGHDPEIKRECIWSGQALRPSAVLVDRRGPLVKTRDGKNDWTILTHGLATFDSMMTHCADPRHTPEMLMLREEMRAVEGGRALGWHIAISTMGRRASDAAPAGVARPQRTGNESAPGSAACLGPAHCSNGRPIAGSGRLSCAGPDRCPPATAELPRDHTREEVRGNNIVRRGPIRRVMAMAGAMSRACMIEYSSARFACENSVSGVRNHWATSASTAGVTYWRQILAQARGLSPRVDARGVEPRRSASAPGAADSQVP
jgi:energy-coupling factor transporter ATP-binding protein EcfA2